MPPTTTTKKPDYYEGTSPVREVILHRLTDAQGNPLPHALNDGLKVCALGNPAAGGACGEYLITGPGRLGGAGAVTLCHLRFQQGPPKKGINGISNEVLLAAVLDRLEGFQGGKYPCIDNERAILFLNQALGALHGRARARLPAENFPP